MVNIHFRDMCDIVPGPVAYYAQVLSEWSFLFLSLCTLCLCAWQSTYGQASHLLYTTLSSQLRYLKDQNLVYFLHAIH